MEPRSHVVIRPGVGMLALFPSMNYKPWYAISEFIDNSLQSWKAHRVELETLYDQKYKLQVDVDFDKYSGTISVTDNAAGIFESDIGRAFTPAVPPEDNSGLSQFGIGMKSAGCWYSKLFTISTSALGEPVRREVIYDIDQIVKSNDDKLPIYESSAKKFDHGTTLTLQRLNHNVPTGRTLGKVRDYLRSIYRDFLADPGVCIRVGGDVLRLLEPEVLTAVRWDRPDSEPVVWRKPFHFTLTSGTEVTGWAGLRAKGKVSGAGLALLYRGKVVQGAGAALGEQDDAYKPRVIFGDGNTFISQRLIGEVDVSAMRVTHSKDAIVWNQDEESEFLDVLRGVIDEEPMPLLRMGNNHRSTQRGRSVNTSVAKTVGTVANAIEAAVILERQNGRNLFDPTPIFTDSSYTPKYLSPPIGQQIFEGAKNAHSETLQQRREVDGLHLRLQVVDDPSDTQWLRVSREGSEYEISMNRGHRFIQSFADLPGMDLEPTLRLAAAVAVAQIKGQKGGHPEPLFFVQQINHILSGPLSEREVGEQSL